MNYFDKLTIKQKLLIPNVAVIVGIVCIMLVYQHGDRLRQQSAQDIQHVTDFYNTVVELRAQALQTENHEKEFLLFNDPQYVDLAAADRAKVDTFVAKLEASAPDAQMLSDVQNSKRLLQNYHDSINRIIASKFALGLDETMGLLGKLRGAVHEVEGILLKSSQIELDNSMLMMRRHEKDFLARLDEKYVTKMAGQQRRFASLLKQSALPDAEKTTIRNKMEQYQQSFLAMVEGRRQVQQETTGPGNALSLLEPVLATLMVESQAFLADAHKQHDAEEARISSMFFTVLIVIGAFIVLLALMVNRMTENLSGLIGKVQASSIQVASSVTEIASSTREQEAAATEHAATTSEVAASIKEISSTSKHLGQTTEEVSHLAQDAADSAADGQALLNSLDTTMSRMAKVSVGIAEKLGALSEKASNIGSMVTTINKVADQTNLLSLNAAIEAEKAGEYGRGFAVVATEIRRLADQTAVATYDIEQMVGEVQSAVSAGVMSMDKFSEEIHSSVEEAKKAGVQLEKIIDQVQALAPHIESVNEGLQAQIEGAGQIDEAMMNLSEAAQQTAEIVRQSNNAITELNDAARGLREGASIFKVKA